jgi:betaine-aldehyde dehydrogenase
MSEMTYPERMLINGQLVDASNGTWFDVVNPATEEIISRAPAADTADVDAAVAAAKAALPAWFEKGISGRAATLRALADAIARDRDELLRLEVSDSGNTRSKADADIDKTIDALHYYAGLGYEIKGESVPSTPGNLHFSIREPLGVVARIVPFNHPLMFAAAKLAAPLITGNTVIMKPSEQSPLTALRLAELCKDLFPAGVVNIITGDGRTAGEALVRHHDVRRVAFIGSVPTGLAIQQAAAQSGVKSVTLELGGKNPFIVFPDADLEEAVSGAVNGMNFSWQGQSCGSTSRLFLHASHYEHGLQLLQKHLEAVRVGDPLDPRTDMGPINSKRQYDKDLYYISVAKQEGARLLFGGERPTGDEFAKGYWLQPTAFCDVTPTMRIFQEEVFGPVLSVVRWTDVDEVIEMANSVEYGLTASVWTNDIDLALTSARRLRAGYLWVNGQSAHYHGTSFGGVKNSGLGREEDLGELLSYTETKTIHVLLRSNPVLRGQCGSLPSSDGGPA